MIYNDIDFHQTTILLAKSRWFMVDHGCIIMIPFVPVKSPWKSTVFFRCHKKNGTRSSKNVSRSWPSTTLVEGDDRPNLVSMGISGSWNGGTLVPYKAIFCGDIPLHRPYIGLIYGRYLQFRFLKWPLMVCLKTGYPLANIQKTMENHHF